MPAGLLRFDFRAGYRADVKNASFVCLSALQPTVGVVQRRRAVHHRADGVQRPLTRIAVGFGDGCGARVLGHLL